MSTGRQTVKDDGTRRFPKIRAELEPVERRLAGHKQAAVRLERDRMRAAEPLAPLARGRPLAIVTDENVRPHLATLQTALDTAGVTSEKGTWNPKPAFFFIATFRTRLKDMRFEKTIDSGNPDVRIDAFETFLTRHPDSQRQVTLLQITPKSRSEVPEYEAMQRTVAEQAGRVNGALGTVDWVPIRYVNRSLRRPALAGLYRMAKLAMVTPLRDGMNLVAKEYVAAQNEEDPGVLLLSRFAGAAQELKEAVLVNPYDVEGTAEALARGLAMPLEERRQRWQGMMATLRENDVFAWCHAFLDDLSGTARTTAPSAAPPKTAGYRMTLDPEGPRRHRL